MTKWILIFFCSKIIKCEKIDSFLLIINQYLKNQKLLTFGTPTHDYQEDRLDVS